MNWSLCVQLTNGSCECWHWLSFLIGERKTNSGDVVIATMLSILCCETAMQLTETKCIIFTSVVIRHLVTDGAINCHLLPHSPSIWPIWDAMWSCCRCWKLHLLMFDINDTKYSITIWKWMFLAVNELVLYFLCDVYLARGSAICNSVLAAMISTIAKGTIILFTLVNPQSFN